VHQFELVPDPVLGLAWKGQPLLLASEAAVTDLINMIDLWQSINQLSLCQSSKPAEVQVPVPRMPAPGDTGPLRRQAYRKRDVQVEYIESVC
jgi:hypothetical protein